MSTKDQNNALLLHSYLRKHIAGQTADAICQHMGIEYEDFTRAVRFSRRCEDHTILANEIVCVTKAAPYLYFLAKRNSQANQYIDKRFVVIEGHLTSVDILLSKQADKFPAHAKEIELVKVQVERVMEDIARVRMGIAGDDGGR